MMNKILIKNDAGEMVQAMAPVIVSASRSTDIPSYYGKWFINRLNRGHILWINPFNQKPSYVSFKDTKVIVFWTKNPAPFLKYLPELDKKGLHYYFQYTLNDYDIEQFEPKIPLLARRIETFKELSSRIGSHRVIWRFDPIVLTPTITPRDILMRIWRIGNQIKGYTNKLVFSFVDVGAYRKVQNNLLRECSAHFTKENLHQTEATPEQIREICEGLVKIRDRWASEGWDISLATCCETVDLEAYGIEHNRCIDDRLMASAFAADSDLLHFLKTGELPSSDNLFKVFSTDEKLIPIVNLKDKGQRKSCGCIVSKDIGMYNTCGNSCVYCYANSSRDLVRKNMKLHSPDGESLSTRTILNSEE